MMYKKLFAYKLLVISVFQIILTCCSYSLTEEDKIRVFYKNDWMFFYGDKGDLDEDFDRNKMAEKGYDFEVFSFDKINDQYKADVSLYLKILNEFVKKNNYELQEYYKCIINPICDKNQLRLMDKKIEGYLKNLLPQLKNGIRCMIAVRTSQFFEIARKIGNNEYATTMPITGGMFDEVFWNRYLRPGMQPIQLPREQVLDEQGVIKYREWFYESNMKIRVVKQIRDEQGNYYGEIYADYYKLDQFDKLFDEKGKPRKLGNTK